MLLRPDEDELRESLELLLLLRDESEDDEDELEYLLRRSLCLELLSSLLVRSFGRVLLFDFEDDFSRYFRDISRSLSLSEEYRVFLRCFSRYLELFGIFVISVVYVLSCSIFDVPKFKASSKFEQPQAI